MKFKCGKIVSINGILNEGNVGNENSTPKWAEEQS